MFVKILLVLLFTCQIADAKGIGRAATQEQLDKLCVPIKLKIDHQIHWFFWKSIIAYTDDEIDITYGGFASNVHRIPSNMAENFHEAKEIYLKVKERNQ